MNRIPKALREFGAVLWQLFVGALFIGVAVAVFRLALHPAIEHLFGLGERAATALRRIGVFLAIALSYWAFVRLYERRAAEELLPRWRWILLGAAAGSVSIALTILILYATGHYQLVAFRGFAAVGIVGVILGAALMEEVLFRGLLFRIVEERFGTLSALIGVSTIFGALHLYNPGGRAVTALSVTLLGLMWTGVFILSRNLWVVTAHHTLWNLTIFTTGLPLSGNEDWRAFAPFETVASGSAIWTGGAFGPEDSILSILVSVACCWGILTLAKRRERFLPARG